jgi:hypothetical protein
MRRNAYAQCPEGLCRAQRLGTSSTWSGVQAHWLLNPFPHVLRQATHMCHFYYWLDLRRPVGDGRLYLQEPRRAFVFVACL